MSIEVLESAAAVAEKIDRERLSGKAIGLVPTMGALHEGHASLIARAADECGFVVVSIFVNPTQFGPSEDFDVYPRTFEADLELCESHGVDLVFAPTAGELYPFGTRSVVKAPEIADLLEGSGRPGHFDGVATVVSKLFAIAGRCNAYFGAKDYQQLQVVKAMAKELCFPVEIVECETVRESDGLALSSRNRRLDIGQRAAALSLSAALSTAKDAIEVLGETSAAEVERIMIDILHSVEGVEVEYAVVADLVSLQHIDSISDEVRLLVAAKVGNVRLIDNVGAIPSLRHGEALREKVVAQ